MNTHRSGPAIVVLAATFALAACAPRAQGPSPSPDQTDPPPSVPADSPVASESPEPSETPAPSQPEDTDIPIPSMGRVLEPTEATSEPGGGTPVAALSPTDELIVQMGPLRLGGTDYYLVSATASQWTGWVDGDLLEATGDPEENQVAAAIDNEGSGTADSFDVAAGDQLYVNVTAAPMAGDEDCQIDITVTTSDGETVTINGVNRISGPTSFFASPLEQSALRLESAGESTIQVRTDCTFAGTVTAIPS